jgi:hypothetical protein
MIRKNDFGPMDFEGAQAPSSSARLKDLANDLLDLKRDHEEAEVRIKSLKQQIHFLTTKIIPQEMAEQNIDYLETAGMAISRDQIVSGSLPADPDRRNKAIDWLKQNDAAGLVRTEVKVAFGVNQSNEALDFIGGLEDHGQNFEAKTSVHPSSLKAFVRERLRSGEDVDVDALGIYIGWEAKVKRKHDG